MRGLAGRLGVSAAFGMALVLGAGAAADAHSLKAKKAELERRLQILDQPSNGVDPTKSRDRSA